MSKDGPGSLAAQVLATGGGEIANRIAQTVSLALVGWILGVEALGVVGLAWSLSTIALAVVQSGPELAGMVELARGESRPAIIIQATRIKIVLAMAAAPILMATLFALGHDDTPSIIQLAAQIAAMTLSGLSYVWVFRAIGRSPEQGILRLFQAVVSVVALAVGLMAWPSPLAVPVSEGMAALATLLIARRRLAGMLALAPSSSPWPSRHLTLSSLRLGAVGMLSSITWLMPVIAAARWAKVEDVSYLTGIMRLTVGMNGIVQLALLAIYPHLAHLCAKDPERGSSAVIALALQTGLVTLVVMSCVAASADWLIPLILGPEFTGAAPIFRGLVPVLFPVALGAPLTYALMAARRSSEVTAIQIAATLATLAACALAFGLFPTAWAAMILHPVLWLQTAASAVVAWRLGIAACPDGNWLRLLDPRHLSRLLAQGAWADRKSASADPP